MYHIVPTQIPRQLLLIKVLQTSTAPALSITLSINTQFSILSVVIFIKQLYRKIDFI